MNTFIKKVRLHINRESALTLSIVVLSFILTVGVVSASTTISTNISTGGTLTVTGTSTLATTTIMGNVGIGTSTPTSKLDIQGNLSTASIGSEIATDSTGAVCSGDGDCVTKSVSVTSGVDYIVQWDQTHSVANNGGVTPKLNGVSGLVQTWGTITAHNGQQQVITANTTGTVNLVFTVSSYSSGTITLANISLKPITKSNIVQRILNSDGSIGVAIRSGGIGLANLFVGAEHAGYNSPGSNNTTGLGNNIYGSATFPVNTSGSYNNAIGVYAMLANTTGSYNEAIGANALQYNTSGDSNVAVGNQSLRKNTTGYNNSAIGNASLNSNTSGTYNVAFGNAALLNNTTGSYNTALGSYAGYSNVTTGSNNIIIGSFVSVPSATGNQQLNIGNLIYGTGVYNGGSASSAPVSGSVGIGIAAPTSQFQVASTTATATTSIEIGKAGGQKSCLVMYDITGTVQYVTIQGGSFVISATSCK
jgi:hypothetical protein